MAPTYLQTLTTFTGGNPASAAKPLLPSLPSLGMSAAQQPYLYPPPGWALSRACARPSRLSGTPRAVLTYACKPKPANRCNICNSSQPQTFHFLASAALMHQMPLSSGCRSDYVANCSHRLCPATVFTHPALVLATGTMWGGSTTAMRPTPSYISRWVMPSSRRPADHY